MIRKLILVGLLVVAGRGSVAQLFIAVVVSVTTIVLSSTLGSSSALGRQGTLVSVTIQSLNLCICLKYKSPPPSTAAAATATRAAAPVASSTASPTAATATLLRLLCLAAPLLGDGVLDEILCCLNRFRPSAVGSDVDLPDV